MMAAAIAEIRIVGDVVAFGDDVNTDVLHPSRFFSLDKLTVKQGLSVGGGEQTQSKIIVGGRNFGYGSSRETTIQSLVYNGYRAVVARTISRIFWRNAVNAGLWVLEVDDVAAIAKLPLVVVEPLVGKVLSPDGVELASGVPVSGYDAEVLLAGGVVPWLSNPLR